MAVQTIIKNTVNLDEPIKKQILTDVLGGSDNQAHKFEVELTRGGKPVTLSGATVYGYFIRPGDITVKLTGGVSGGTAYVVLNEHCYVTPGRFSFAMKVQVGEVLHTVLLYEGCVAVTQGEGVVDDGYTIPSLTEWMNNIRKPNLLDNSDFSNPINQRGATTTTKNNTYFIDRWIVDIANNAASVSIDANGLTLAPTSNAHASVYQRLEHYDAMAGKTYTLGVCVNGVWEAVSFTMSLAGSGKTLPCGLTVYSTGSYHVLIRNVNGGSPVTIQRVALYEGSYTAETLPAYVPKGYAAELVECMRYYQKVYRVYGSGVGNVSREAIILPMPMRITPTVSTFSEWAGSSGAGYAVQGISTTYIDVQYTGWGNVTLAISADL